MAKRSRDVSVSSSSASETGEQDSHKYAHTESQRSQQSPSTAIRCFLPPHSRPSSFASYEAFDSHYYKAHVNRCSECEKNFPSELFLHLHIAEVHDALAEARRARGERTFGCFHEGCEKLCYTPQKRRLHVIDKHHFPKNYNFFITKDGIDKRHSLLVPKGRRRALSQQWSEVSVSSSGIGPEEADSDADAAGMSVELGSSKLLRTAYVSQTQEECSSPEPSSEGPMVTPTSSQPDTNMDALAKGMSSLKFVPPSIRFGRGGRGRARGGLARQ